MKTVDTSVRGVMAAEIHKHSHFCIESAKKFLGREFQLHKVHTVWKFQNFSTSQILCEKKFEKCHFSGLRGFEFCVWLIFSPQKLHKSIEIFTASKMLEMAIFALLDSLDLISRKIKMAGKS